MMCASKDVVLREAQSRSAESTAGVVRRLVTKTRIHIEVFLVYAKPRVVWTLGQDWHGWRIGGYIPMRGMRQSAVSKRQRLEPREPVAQMREHGTP
jgi:hypothetical protein